MHILSKYVDLLEKHDIFLHDPGVLLLVHVLVLLQHLSQIVNVVFKVLSLVGVFPVQVGVSLLILDLFLDVLLVEADDALLEFLEVSDVMQALEHIVLELLLEALLVIQLLAQVRHLVSQALLSHSEIINDQSQVLINTIKVLKLLSHLVGLLIKLLDFNLTGSNVTLELLDLVIEDELELLKLLCLLLQVIDALVLVADGGLTLLNLSLLRVDLLAE